MGLPTVGAIFAALGVIVSLANPEFERALSLGRRSDAERARFHDAYLTELNVGDRLATVERIEVVTEFRRAVMVVEDRARFGDYMFGLRQLEAAVRPFHNQVAIRARLRLNPLSVLPDVPAYELRVGAPDDRLLALGSTARSPIYSMADEHFGRALIGANVEIAYDSGIVGQGRYPVAVVLGGATVASTTINFAGIE